VDGTAAKQGELQAYGTAAKQDEPSK